MEEPLDDVAPQTIDCHSRNKLAASVVNCPIARFVQSIFTLKSAKWPEQMTNGQTLKALEKRIKSVYQICTFGQVMPNFCTFGHFMAFLVARDFTSCASNHLLRGQVMPFLWPFYSESDKPLQRGIVVLANCKFERSASGAMFPDNN